MFAGVTTTTRSTASRCEARCDTAVRFRNILFATDFSPTAAQAIPYVKKIAKHYEADLVTLNVRPPVVNTMVEPATWPVDIEAARAENEKHREEMLHTFAGIRTQVRIDEGSIQACLGAAIEKNNSDLVVIGTRGRTGLGKILMGSVAEEILRTVSCPVLTVGPHSDSSREASGEFREILYATDLSPQSQGAAEYAVSLAQEFQARLVLLHVISEPEVGDLVRAADVMTSSKNLLRKLVPPEAEEWCKPEYFVVRGDPSAKILEFATSGSHRSRYSAGNGRTRRGNASADRDSAQGHFSCNLHSADRAPLDAWRGPGKVSRNS